MASWDWGGGRFTAVLFSLFLPPPPPAQQQPGVGGRLSWLQPPGGQAGRRAGPSGVFVGRGGKRRFPSAGGARRSDRLGSFALVGRARLAAGSVLGARVWPRNPRGMDVVGPEQVRRSHSSWRRPCPPPRRTPLPPAPPGIPSPTTLLCKLGWGGGAAWARGGLPGSPACPAASSLGPNPAWPGRDPRQRHPHASPLPPRAPRRLPPVGWRRGLWGGEARAEGVPCLLGRPPRSLGLPSGSPR